MLRDETVYGTWVVGWMVALLLLGVGCGSGSETSGESDARDGPPDLPISEGCVEACENFLEVCGGRARISKARCELGCERDWSEELQTCIAEAPTCGAIETCSKAGGGDAGVSDASDGTDASDVSEGADVSDVSDVSSGMDVADTSDVSGMSDVGVSDVSEGTDVSDALDVSDTMNGADSTDASDVSEMIDGVDGADGGDVADGLRG